MPTVSGAYRANVNSVSSMDSPGDVRSISPETILALIQQRTDFVQGQLKTILGNQKHMNEQMRAINDCMAVLEQYGGDKGLKGHGDDQKALKAMQDCCAKLRDVDPNSPILANVEKLRDELIEDFGPACKQALGANPPASLHYDGSTGDAVTQTIDWASHDATKAPEGFDPQKDIYGTIEEPFHDVDGKGVQSLCDRLKDVTSSINADSSMLMLDAQDLASKLQQINQFGSNLLQAVEEAPKTAIANIGRG